MALCCYIAVEYLLSQILTNIDIATAAFNLTIGKTKHLEIMTKMREMKAMTMMVGWCSLSHAFGRKVKREEKHFCMYVAHWCD